MQRDRELFAAVQEKIPQQTGNHDPGSGNHYRPG
jgi:hypothetical protein